MDTLKPEVLEKLFFSTIEAWHENEESITTWEDTERHIQFPEDLGDNTFLKLLFYLQLINCYQWHEEDKSHRDDLSDKVLAEIKKNIDRSNQRRNDLVEYFDHQVMAWYGELPKKAGPEAPLNSETPGSILDRLTVLALKINHLAARVDRAPRENGASRQAFPDSEDRKKLRILQEQWTDLMTCFQSLVEDFQEGRKRMQVYFQYKIYGLSVMQNALFGREGSGKF